MKEGKSFEVTQHQVLAAYKRVKANQGAAGIDGVTFVEYEKDLKNNLYTLWNRMASGSYFPMAVKGVEIPKKNGKKRLLGIPTIMDRVAQMVVKISFEPLVEPVFCEDSYGYRPNRSALDAVGVTRERCWNSPWVLEFDIKGLFDNIDHDLMMQVVRKHTDVKWVVLYIERFLKADMVMPDGTVSKRTSGTPQGGVISPVLANLYMHYAFDRWMATQNPTNQWARYADDGVVHCQTREDAEGLLERLKKRLASCKLEVHPDKTRIVYCRSGWNKGRHEHESFDFLGYTFRRRLVRSKKGNFFETFTPAVGKGAAQHFRDEIREICRNGKLLNPEEMAKLLNPVVRGWANYFCRFNPTEARKVLRYVNSTLVRWAKRRYKRLRFSLGKAFRWLARLAQECPDMFHHWEMGIRPTISMRRAV
jgi:RNA-directed DNA polymerase